MGKRINDKSLIDTQAFKPPRVSGRKEQKYCDFLAAIFNSLNAEGQNSVNKAMIIGITLRYAGRAFRFKLSRAKIFHARGEN
jgi:hypothetical protein